MEKKIIILDFSTAEVHIFTYDEGVVENFNDFIEMLNEEEGFNFSESNCQWMIVEELKLFIH